MGRARRNQRDAIRKQRARRRRRDNHPGYGSDDERIDIELRGRRSAVVRINDIDAKRKSDDDAVRGGIAIGRAAGESGAVETGSSTGISYADHRGNNSKPSSPSVQKNTIPAASAIAARDNSSSSVTSKVGADARSIVDRDRIERMRSRRQSQKARRKEKSEAREAATAAAAASKAVAVAHGK
jgi:hypothetical protein